MKSGIIVGLCLFSQLVFADGLPVITVQPTNQIVSPGDTATLTVSATGATSFQWRFNGTDISGETNLTLQIPNAQTNNSGYYMAVAKNATDWVPSQMAWLSVVASAGIVPLSNNGNDYDWGQVFGGFIITNGSAQMVAGPALDEMQPCGLPTTVSNGYYGSSQLPTRSVPTVNAGQPVYYSILITSTNPITTTLPSTVMLLTAGGNGVQTPSCYGLKFPAWIEWPDPWFVESDLSRYFPGATSSPTNQIRVPGETFSLTNVFWGSGEFDIATWQWRKNGVLLGSPQNFLGGLPNEGAAAILNITNAQPADAGIYDVVILGGGYWLVGPKTILSIQTTNGCGVFQSPRLQGANFICDLLGAAGRNYKVQWSTNLTAWNDLVTLSNSAGTVTFSNSPVLGGAQFYRTVLLP